jgi:hypothetical protein
VQQIEPVLIPCENVRPGMFSDERLVTVRDHTGELFPMFTDFDLLVERNNRYYIPVTRMGNDQHNAGVSVCLLPVAVTETPTMTRWVRVADCEIVKP